MNAPALLQRLFPPPRRRITAWSAAPLVVFMALYAGTWLSFELAGVIRFSSPGALALVAVCPWIWWMSAAGWSGLGRGRAVLALTVRLALVGVFVMLLAGPRAVRTRRCLSVMYVVDLSDSVGEKEQDSALSYVVRTVAGRGPEFERDEAGLVVFGRDAAVELPPRTTFPFEAVNSRIPRDGTNIEKALLLAAACLPDENQGRIVLVSDGAETEGDVRRVLGELVSRDIAVDVWLPKEYDFEDEVWLEKLELPRFVKAGETYEAAVVLSSLRAGSGKLVLKENGEPVAEAPVDFGPGKNRYTLPLRLRGPGFYEYEARIEVPPERDGWPENNVAIDQLYLKGKGRTLVVTDPGGNPADWRRFVRALEEARKLVEVRDAGRFPRDALALMPYDCIVFVNVPAEAFDPVQLACLRDAVYGQGSGFLMVGGKDSFGPGGYHRTPVEEVLPVTMDVTQKKVLPKGALVIVLHTCEFAEGNTWAKRITKKAIKVLGSKDEVGVLAYGFRGASWLFELTPAGEYEKLVPLINQAVIGDMPDFGTTMRMGLKALQKSDAAAKHMILISDGDPSPPTPALVRSFAQAQISCSTVTVNPHGGVDVQVMQAIAGATKGRHYFPKDASRLPAIFVKEAKTLKRSMIQNRTFTPEQGFPSPIMKGIEAVPRLHGYVITTPRGRSRLILEVPGTEDVEPVLATWRYGLGKTAAFTSDLSPNWGADWVGWDRYRAFCEQLVTDVSRVESESDLHMRAAASGSTGVISIEDYGEKGSFLDITARVSGPRGRSKTIRLKQVGSRRYRGTFPLWGEGRYQVMAAGVAGGRTERVLGGFAVPYSPEYLRFRSDPICLRRIAEETGGRLLTGEESGADVFGTEREPRESSRPVEDWFLIVLACLVPLDVAIRRVQLDMSIILGWFVSRLDGRRKEKMGPSGRTLGRLLKRKKSFEFGAGEKEATPLPGAPPQARREAKPAAMGTEKRLEAGAGEPEPEELSTPEDLTTTARLLKLKKRWKSDDEEKS